MSDVQDEFYELAMKEPEFIQSFIEELYNTWSVEKDILENEDMLGGPPDVFGMQEEVISKLLFPSLLTTSSIETEG